MATFLRCFRNGTALRMAIVNENDENKNYFAKNMVFKVFAYVASCGVFVSNAH